SGLAEESVERIVSTPDGLVCGHLAIRLDAVLQAVKLPAGITDLDSSLANVYRDALTHFDLSFFLCLNVELNYNQSSFSATG
ncbi:hypothetical protein NL445_28555, partial [Klebsiella pneumoniae]|nr:hypothetical protein [Klebsiella pneumoniae]